MKAFALFIVVSFAVEAGLVEATSAQRKFDSIEHGTARPRSTVRFSLAELDSWTKEEARFRVPQGARDLRFELSEGRATGFARIDFLKLRQANGGDPGFVLRRILAGERPVSVGVRFTSRNGQARVDVERVEVSGVPLEGAGLEFLIQTFVRPSFPEARVGEWFALDQHVEHFAVHPDGVTVVLK